MARIPIYATQAGVETGSFLSDVRIRAETPFHRAAAYGDAEMISFLLTAGADKTIRDCNGDSSLTWASWHLRPGSILQLLAHGSWQVGEWHVKNLTSDHGKGWGNGMEKNFFEAQNGEVLERTRRVPRGQECASGFECLRSYRHIQQRKLERFE